MDYLVKEGFEIGNHTIHHLAGIRHWPDARVEAELAGAVANIHHYEPNYVGGHAGPALRRLPQEQEAGHRRRERRRLLPQHLRPEGGRGSRPPRRWARTSSTRTSTPTTSRASFPGAGRDTIHYWLELMEKQKALKYVSDGDPNTFTVNTIAKGQINLARLKNGRFHLRTYTGRRSSRATEAARPPCSSPGECRLNAITFLFWNVNRQPLQEQIASLAETHSVDVIMLAECVIEPTSLLTLLNRPPPERIVSLQLGNEDQNIVRFDSAC